MAEITQEVIEEIKSLENRKGQITPLQVIDAAKDESNPLHNFFTWDDTEAAIQYRIEQARTLIRAVTAKITVSSYTVAAPVYVKDPTVPQTSSGYISVKMIKQNNTKLEVINDEVARIIGNLQRTIAIVTEFNGKIPPFVLENLESALTLMQEIKALKSEE